jgi:L-alanine-DL-glutamate epimerase-like enolase superfamily enzyme
VGAAADAIARLTTPLVVHDATDAFALAMRVAPGSASARFAIEAALCDALARRAGCSLAAVLQPTPATRVALSAVVDTADDARAAFAAGVRTLKLKLGPDEPLERVRAIAAAAPGARLRIDANRTWPIDGVAARLAALADDAIAYVEEPCRDVHRVLDQPLACKLALDESLAAIDPSLLAPDARSSVASTAILFSPQLAALVLKPTLLGLGTALAFAQFARARGLAAVISHGLEGPIGTAACAELALALNDPAPAGVAAHPALTGWKLPVPQLAADHVHAVAASGLAAIAADLDAVIAAAPEPA